MLRLRPGRRDARRHRSRWRASCAARGADVAAGRRPRSPGALALPTIERASGDRAAADDPELLPARERARARTRPRSGPPAAPEQGDGDASDADRARQRSHARRRGSWRAAPCCSTAAASRRGRRGRPARAEPPRASISAATCCCRVSSTRRSTAAAACCSTTSRPSTRSARSARAHRRFGTTGFLPTLISDDLHVVARAIAAVRAAIDARRARRARHPHRGPVPQRRTQGRARRREVPRARRGRGRPAHVAARRPHAGDPGARR